MRPHRLLLPALLTALAACATAPDTTSNLTPPASNPMTGANARPDPSPLAVGAYSAIGTSDDVRGRSSGGGTSVLTGRANMAGADSGTSDVNGDTGATSSSSSSGSDEDTTTGKKKTPPY